MDIATVPKPARSRFWTHLDALLPIAGDLLDLGTGTGRVALDAAPRARAAIGVDIDASSLEAARWDAGRRGIRNAEFHQADAEAADLLALHGGRPFAIATARLFLSPRMLERIPTLLEPRGHVVIEALEAANWREAGGSRFNLAAAHVVEALERGGLLVEDACVEQEIHPFTDAKAAEAHLKDRRLWTRWRQDGRWDTLRAAARRGGSLTEAHLVVRAVRSNA